MTFSGQQTRTGANLLKVLVLVTIVWVAYWASTGGLDRISVTETSATTTTLSG